MKERCYDTLYLPILLCFKLTDKLLPQEAWCSVRREWHGVPPYRFTLHGGTPLRRTFTRSKVLCSHALFGPMYTYKEEVE